MSAISYPSERRTDRFDLVLRIFFIGLVLFMLAIAMTLVGFEIWYTGRVYPGVSVSGVDVSGLKPAAAASKINATLNFSQSGRIILRDGQQSWLASPADLGYAFNAAASADSAYQIGRRGGILQSFSEQLQAWWASYDLPQTVIFDQRITQRYLLALAKQINKPVIEANLGLNGVEVAVHSGQIGRTLDVDKALTLVTTQLQTSQDGIVLLPVKETPPIILDANQQAEIARKILSAPLTLVMPDGGTDAGPWTLDQNTLASMLSIERVQGQNTASYQVGINPDILRTFLTSLAPSLVQSSQNARFTFNDSSHQLEVIQHAIIGRSLNVEETIKAVNDKLAKGEHSVSLVFDIHKPAAADDATGEQLGIRQLVQSTTTYFYGSNSARIQNITTASSRFHGLLVAPGETFSMAQALGNISLDNGYAEALIILGNQTIKGVGGGVCQVSTTLFRTVFYAGYPINERHPHAYRVGYYEQKSNGHSDPNLAGLDATVFVPLVDFKFTNDTPYWLLMETYVKGYSLTWKFYSTADGRSVEWDSTGPTNITPAPDPLYRENPDLKKGEIKQVDYSAEGADITVNRRVLKDGNVLFQDRFITNYEPWRAIYEYGPGTEDIPTPAPTSNP